MLPHVLAWILVIVFWTPGKDHPTKLEAGVYPSNEFCAAYAQALDAKWISEVHGGSTSWSCLGTYPQPTT
jgi:hypothetical protein